MSGLALQISIPRDSATPGVASLAAGLTPERLNPIVGRSARNTYRDHLFGLNGPRANRLGGPRTNYYAGAARATQFRIEGDAVIVSINQVGIAQRYFGGTIKPRLKKYLTIPARAEAYGKRASEFSDLVVLFGRKGPYALARAAQSLITTKRDGSIARRGSAGGEILFWLVKEVTQQPDPTVLPSPELVGAQASRAVLDYANLIWQRRSGDRGRTFANGGPNS